MEVRFYDANQYSSYKEALQAKAVRKVYLYDEEDASFCSGGAADIAEAVGATAKMLDGGAFVVLMLFTDMNILIDCIKIH